MDVIDRLEKFNQFLCGNGYEILYNNTWTVPDEHRYMWRKTIDDVCITIKNGTTDSFLPNSELTLAEIKFYSCMAIDSGELLSSSHGNQYGVSVNFLVVNSAFLSEVEKCLYNICVNRYSIQQLKMSSHKWYVKLHVIGYQGEDIFLARLPLSHGKYTMGLSTLEYATEFDSHNDAQKCALTLFNTTANCSMVYLPSREYTRQSI